MLTRWLLNSAMSSKAAKILRPVHTQPSNGKTPSVQSLLATKISITVALFYSVAGLDTKRAQHVRGLSLSKASVVYTTLRVVHSEVIKQQVKLQQQ
ncbi:hypothetical protein ElyMa_004513900 [Elysia marginata]|uniref:Uncharacterized protein n=1 Tax=Elysia marginata TaxID=1093978 RepID=A0AAV4HMU8_9GAST|nr:hypothetical protein ElyMa_004513900 [Elysia marginata]